MTEGIDAGRGRVSRAVAEAGDGLLRVSVRGVVQGVGFRPFVYQLAGEHGLRGWVCNTSGDVKIEAEGARESLQRFLEELTNRAPPMARIEDVAFTWDSPSGYTSFEIRQSVAESEKYQLVSPDIATCDQCLAEVLSPQDRRYRYPFTNCTNCGPRFTIIEDIPYDRPKTTMRVFTMCPECQREYEDPMDRRFHAQPNACPVCGPELSLLDPAGRPLPCDDTLAEAARLLRNGNVLAVKGLGGFLLACDATSETAVHTLRERKRRPHKPFAVMLADLDEVRHHCEVSEQEEELLRSPASPIVLLRWRHGSNIAKRVAPGLDYMGVMIPYTPMHHLLLREAHLPLVMTSGNLSEEPIAKDNDEALVRLGGIADCFLVHNRGIHSRYDDSVALVEFGKARVIRRARGYAPYPIHLPFSLRQVLACGPELKNTFCLIRDNHAFVSQHIGDMENLETMNHFESTIELYRQLFRIDPEIVAYDMHPEYLSTKYALSLAETRKDLEFVAVQHHHAHIVSCMVENEVKEPVIGVSFDGTGYGTDGCIWGGEFMVADLNGFQRLGHFEYVPMPGGAVSIHRPYRMAASYVLTLLGGEALTAELPACAEMQEGELDIIRRQLASGINSPLTSSAGRLFDAVSALIGVRGVAGYDAQAAIELEMVAADGQWPCYDYVLDEQDGVSIMRLSALFAGVLGDLRGGVPPSGISAKFHETMARLIADVCDGIKAKTGISRVALSGGVFQNRLLLRLAVSSLQSAGFDVITHERVPTNDGGVSLGQAVIAGVAG